MTLARATRWAAIFEASLLAVLAASGLYLSFHYRPEAASLYTFGDDAALRNSVRVASGVRNVHLVASGLFIWVGVGLAVLCVYWAFARRAAGDTPVALRAVGFALLALFASFTGYLLPWDQLALYAVTGGVSYNGLWKAAFSDDIRFVIIGSVEIGQATLRRWLIVHVFVVPPVAAATLYWAHLRRRPVSEA